MFGEQFYPTPESLAQKMLTKINWSKVRSVCDPSAGKGDLLAAVADRTRYSRQRLCAIEIDPNLQAILSDKYTLIDSDFLTYSGSDQFDVFLMNPPFKNGDEHLLRAIDMMFSGQIACILNAETLKNPYSNTRKSLVRKLEELGANIEYHSNAFSDAERKTDVEIALIYINIERSFDELCIDGMTDSVSEFEYEAEDDTSLALNDDIYAIVARYEFARTKGIETITEFYKNYKLLGKYLFLNKERGESICNITDTVKVKVNEFLSELRRDYWKEATELPSITKNLTADKRKAFLKLVEQRSNMEFTANNVMQFAKNISESYIDTLKDSAVRLFDSMTRQYSYYPEMKRNILHFDGWKTNNAFKIGKKVILPGFNWYPYVGSLRVSWEDREKLNDIDKVMSYFSGGGEYLSIADALEEAFKLNETRKVVSTFFTINTYQKGTIHLTFNDLTLVRRFNLFVCKEKAWLPHDYGTKPYDDMSADEQEVAKSFDGKRAYNEAVKVSRLESSGVVALLN